MKYLNTPISDDLDKKLYDFSKKHGVYKKKIVELALEKYIESNNKKNLSELEK